MFIWILRVVAFIFLVWFIAPIFKGYYNAGNKLGILMCLFVLLFYTNTPVFDFVKNFCHNYPFLTVLWNGCKILIFAFILYAVLITALMIIASLIKPQKESTAIALGIRAEKHGPSDLLKGRIVATKKHLDKNENCVAILSGGKCKRDFEEEGVCMYNELLKMGIKPDRLIVENKALSTYENILFSQKIIDSENKKKNLAIVSDRFHQLRARLIVRKLKIKSKVGAVNSQTAFLYIPTYYVREWIALPYEVLFRFRPHR